MTERPDDFLLYLFYALMVLTLLAGIFGGLGWLADKLDELTRGGDRRR